MKILKCGQSAGKTTVSNGRKNMEKTVPPQEWSREELLAEYLKLKSEHEKLLQDKHDEDAKRIAMYQKQIQDQRQGHIC